MDETPDPPDSTTADWIREHVKRIREVTSDPVVRETLLDLFSGADPATKDRRLEQQARKKLDGAGLQWQQAKDQAEADEA
jgi:hypothetical protein